MVWMKFFFFVLVSVSVTCIGAEELVSFQVEGGDHLEVLSEDSFTRPLRQVRYTQSYIILPHKEKPAVSVFTGLEEEATQKFIEQYSTSGGLSWLKTVMKRGEQYQSFIRNEIEKRGLPEELVYLPVIESAYSTTAVSRAGATGLWQFMRNSIGPYGMKVTEWMDERRDFWKSTIGALNKLEDNYKQFGSWELALAAYNAGTGTVSRALKKYPDADYWELCEKGAFKKETIQYVPRLLAVSHILSNPRSFGLDVFWPDDPQWTLVPVGRSVDLGLVAEYAGIAAVDLKKANSELHYGITPPDPNYTIKVPMAQAQAVVSVLENPDLALIKYYFHIIRKGDTLSGIAQNYGISINQITGNNPGIRPTYLNVGQRLIIPAMREIKTASAPAPKKKAQAAYSGTHLVKKGESLWSIALAYNTNPETLAAINGMRVNEVLRAGRSLKTPASY
jgi:membrane-bound lytic murein transglycosylase D